MMITQNPFIKYWECIKCGVTYPIDQDYFEGCPACRSEGEPSSLTIRYRLEATSLLPFEPDQYISLGEGNTPLLRNQILETKYGLEAFFIKQEGMNPTGSHKDRASAFIVSRALDTRAKGVVIASSGNAGLSLAAYAARCGMECIVISTKLLNQRYYELMKGYGANILLVNTSMERWVKVKEYVDHGYFPATNFSIPPVGSNPFGVQGYKNISYELLDFISLSNHFTILVPSSRGDLLWGIYEGFLELKEMKKINRIPRLVAIEPFPRLQRVLVGEKYTEEFEGSSTLTSIGGNTVTYQAEKALRDSGGIAVTVKGEQARVFQNMMMKHGICLEDSSASAIAAIPFLLKTGVIKRGDSVIAIGTSNGFLEL